MANRLDSPTVTSVLGRQGALGGGIWRPPISGGSTALVALGHSILRAILPNLCGSIQQYRLVRRYQIPRYLRR